MYIRYRSGKSNENEISYAVPVTGILKEYHTQRWNEKKIHKKYDPRKLLLENHRKVNKLLLLIFSLLLAVLFCDVNLNVFFGIINRFY